LSGDPIEAPRAFAWPAALSVLGLERRPETDADLAFLVEVFASTRREEFEAAGWPSEALETFLRSQFDAQRHHYRTHFTACEFDVLELNGQPIGRLYLDPMENFLHVVDIALLPEWRAKGFGGAVMTAIKEAAAASGRGFSIMVEQQNPARRLYDRLGLEVIADHGVYLEMAWRPDGQLKTAS
jgi:ribosomal protein S18 acetylase RimI-like enzyme